MFNVVVKRKMALNNIKFDDILQVDTTLAEEYLQKKQKTFRSMGYKDQENTCRDPYRNLIYYADYTRFSGAMVLVHDISEIPKKLFNLAKKIEEAVDLFCQLDYLIRKTPVNGNKNVDLKLLVQNLLYWSRSKSIISARSSSRNRSGGFMWSIMISSTTSLAALGCVAQALMSNLPHVVITCTADTAAVCCLFTDLCHQVGLQEKVRLAILTDIQIGSSSSSNTVVDVNSIRQFETGCLGIVATKSDVDSAVETFIAGDDRRPWQIKKILVQEGALQRFKNTLEWKTKCQQNITRVTHAKSNTIIERLQAQSTSLYNYQNKTFLLEYTGTKLDENDGNTILIESYRTTKELLSILKDSDHFAASLWCSDVAESNEIAFNINPNIIWINDYCNFNGPPKSSQGFYSLISAHFSLEYIEACPEYDRVLELRDSWLQVDQRKREDIARDVLMNAPLMKGVRNKDYVDDIDSVFDSFMCVEEKGICHGTELSPGVLIFRDALDIGTISFIVKGGGLMFYEKKYPSDEFTTSVLQALKEKGAPIVGLKRYLSLGGVRVWCNQIYKMKVVWSRFGTIFAN